MCKELGLKELAAKYNVSVLTFSKHIEPVRVILLGMSPNKKRLRIFTPKMIQVVYQLLGDPDEVKKIFKDT